MITLMVLTRLFLSISLLISMIMLVLLMFNVLRKAITTDEANKLFVLTLVWELVIFNDELRKKLLNGINPNKERTKL